MTKVDFAKQFNETHFIDKVYCQNKYGKTVWLYCNKYTLLTLKINDGSSVRLKLLTIKLKQGVIEAVKFNIWVPSSKINKYNLDEVLSITIPETSQEYDLPFFNIDSSLALLKHKNDSLKNIYNSGHETLIYFTSGKTKHDTIEIVENICYNLSFKNGTKTKYGVVQKITKDSIFITNFFNSNVALKNNKQFELLGFPFGDIIEIRLFKSGGLSYKTISLGEYFLSTKTRSRYWNYRPLWFAMQRMTGDIRFYRLWKTERGYSGLTEQNGNIYWYEGQQVE